MPGITSLGFTKFNRRPSILDEQDDNPAQTFVDDIIPGSVLSEINANKITTGNMRVTDYIQSEDFVTLTSGWRIHGDGTAEFQTVIAGSYITVFRQDAIPTSLHIGDLWVDTDDENQLYRAASIGADQITAGEWITVRDTAYEAKIITFIQASAPTALATGDLWIDSDDNNKMYRWSGSAWVSVIDGTIAVAQSAAEAAQATADGKVTTFYQDAAPTAEGAGDLWVDTNDTNKLYRWSGSAWVSVVDSDIAQAISDAATAQSTADGKIVTFYQDAIPTATDAGDLWVDTDDGNKLYRSTNAGDDQITAGEWIEVQDTDIAQAITDASTAQAEADRKVITFIQASAPTAEQTGDVWFDSDDENKVYRWSGSAWASAQDLAANWSLIVDDDTNKPDNNADVTGDNTAADTVNVDVRLSTDFVGFGNGIDGTVTISGNTTLTSDMYYDDLTINNAIVLTTAGYRVFVKGTLTNNGTIRFNGNNGANGENSSASAPQQGGAGGALVADGNIRGSRAGADGADNGENPSVPLDGGAGGAENPSIGSAGAAGGAGGQESGSYPGGAGGAAGTATAEKLLYDLLIKSEELTAATEDEINLVPVYEIPLASGRSSGGTLSTSAGGGGGGQGGTNNSAVAAAGGGAGATGGCMFICAKTLTNSGTIEANGGTGGAGGAGNSAENEGGAGGGAGGSGGVVILFYETITVGTITASAGTAGSGGATNGAGTAGTAGTNGVAGKIYRLKKI